MTDRSPAQALLAERLDGVRDARQIVLRAPVGTGVVRTLAQLVTRKAADGLVLIVSPLNALLDQWSNVLEQQPGTEVIHHLTADLALELASETSDLPGHGILLAARSAIRRGPVGAALRRLNLALMFFDGLPNAAARSEEVDVIRRAQQVIILDHKDSPKFPAWLDTNPGPGHPG
ncbi:DEAD/DEAH box helicase family protein [Dactylosporangium salmoneum]|uniref:Uncharacterized protein n=1 Tax=Dactylosporangium salmoneum TaxID=53361 RepID=A0ABN3FWV0_9ACTN